MVSARLLSLDAALGTSQDPHGFPRSGGGLRDFLVRPVLVVEDVALSPHGSAFVYVQMEGEMEQDIEKEQG